MARYFEGMETHMPETFVPVSTAAIPLGVPSAWLKREVQAGRLPHLRAGRRVLVNVEAVRRALLERSHQEATA